MMMWFLVPSRPQARTDPGKIQDCGLLHSFGAKFIELPKPLRLVVHPLRGEGKKPLRGDGQCFNQRGEDGKTGLCLLWANKVEQVK